MGDGSDRRLICIIPVTHYKLGLELHTDYTICRQITVHNHLAETGHPQLSYDILYDTIWDLRLTVLANFYTGELKLSLAFMVKMSSSEDLNGIIRKFMCQVLHSTGVSVRK